MDYVLSRFTRSEQSVIDRIVDDVPSMVRSVLQDGVGEAMNRYNGLDAATDQGS